MQPEQKKKNFNNSQNIKNETLVISDYRLGDLFEGLLSDNEISLLIQKYPNTIGSEYALATKKMQVKHKNIDVMIKIVIKYITKYLHLMPEDIINSTVMHLRLGDVVAGNEFHEKMKRPISLDILKNIVPINQKLYIIGKCFFAKTSSTNYDECIEMSNIYLNSIVNELNANHLDGGHADIDLCYAVKSKCFIQGRGFFSKLIVNVRNFLNLKNIESEHITKVNA